MTTRKKTLGGKEFGRKPYMLDEKDYIEWHEATTEKEMLDQYTSIQQSEFKKPYACDRYDDMEYEYPAWPAPPPFPPNPPPPPGPGPFPPWPPPGPGPDPPSPPHYTACRCTFNGCFCPGDTKCSTLNCDHAAIFATVTSGDGIASLPGGGKQLCIKAGQTAKSRIGVMITMREAIAGPPGNAIPCYADFNVDECPEKDCGCKKCEGETIGYTTQEMSCGATQTLTVQNAREKCKNDYTWLVSGGGSISPSTGTSVTYTSAATNPDCVNNGTITLKIKDEVCATLKIAANCNPESSYYAYRNCFPSLCREEPWYICAPYNITMWCVVQKLYNCDNSRGRPPSDNCPYGCGSYDGVGTMRGCCNNICAPGCTSAQVLSECYNTWGNFGPICCNEILDERTAFIKASGCCPAALL